MAITLGNPPYSRLVRKFRFHDHFHRSRQGNTRGSSHDFVFFLPTVLRLKHRLWAIPTIFSFPSKGKARLGRQITVVQHFPFRDFLDRTVPARPAGSSAIGRTRFHWSPPSSTGTKWWLDISTGNFPSVSRRPS